MKKLNIKELGLDDDYIIENEGIEYAISKTYFALRKAIDLVNSQQEAIGELQTEIGVLRNMVLPLEPADDKPEYKLPGTEEIIEKLDKATLRPNLVDGIADDTHRTVTLRIPKGMTFVEALFYADLSLNMSDNQAKKALDEVQPNE